MNPFFAAESFYPLKKDRGLQLYTREIQSKPLTAYEFRPIISFRSQALASVQSRITVPGETETNFASRAEFKFPSLFQLFIFFLRFYQDRNVWIGSSPERKEILI